MLGVEPRSGRPVSAVIQPRLADPDTDRERLSDESAAPCPPYLPGDRRWRGASGGDAVMSRPVSADVGQREATARSQSTRVCRPRSEVANGLSGHAQLRIRGFDVPTKTGHLSLVTGTRYCLGCTKCTGTAEGCCASFSKLTRREVKPCGPIRSELRG